MKELQEFIGKAVVIDTDSRWVFLGILESVSENMVTLVDADAHDQKDAPTTKEAYVMDSKKYGVRKNRKKVWINRSMIVSISLLDDVIEY